MDGDGMAPAQALIQDRTLGDRGPVGRATKRRAKTARWFVIMGLLLTLVLGGLYGFSRFRDHAIATFFANNRPPPRRSPCGVHRHPIGLEPWRQASKHSLTDCQAACL